MEPGELAEEGEGPVGKGPVGKFMEPGELAEEGEGPVGKGPVEGEGPVGIAAEPEAAPEATPIEAAAEEAKAAEEEAAAEEAAAEEAEEAKAAAEEAAAAEEEEEEALVFLALAPSRAPGKASTSTLRNDEETRARVRAHHGALHEWKPLHARLACTPQQARAHHGALSLSLPHRCTRSSSRWTRMGAATCHARSSPPNCMPTVSRPNDH